jgi:hypothetical protein
VQVALVVMTLVVAVVAVVPSCIYPLLQLHQGHLTQLQWELVQ